MNLDHETPRFETYHPPEVPWHTHPETVNFLKKYETKIAEPKKNILTGKPLNSKKNISYIGYLHDGLLKVALNFNNIKNNPSKSRGAFKKQQYLTQFVIGKNRWFGADTFLPNQNFFDHITLSSCQYCLIPLEEFEANAPREAYLSYIHDQSRNYHYNAFQNYVNRYSLKIRTLFMITHLRRQFELPEIPISQSELANLIGTYRSKLSPILKDLEKEGLIECQFKSIIAPPLKEIDPICMTRFVKEIGTDFDLLEQEEEENF